MIHFDVVSKEKELLELEKQTMSNEFWSDTENSSKVLKRITDLKNKLNNFKKINSGLENLKDMNELLQQEPDEELVKELLNNTIYTEKEIDKLEITILLSGNYDMNNAIVTIHPGAGGTEAQDWAEMLYRMYSRWATDNGYEIKELDYLDGEEAGIKSVTFLVSGSYAYGYLKGEMGVHRLVRISPFDAGGRRHTSFASVEVLPEIAEDIEVYINPDDLRIDTYRASGAGGQHVNKTSSAIRITHIPTGIVVACQNERSQLQNKETAMKMLRSKLYEIEQEKQENELATTRRLQVGSGARSEKIRTYNYPQSRVTDHRINYTIYQLESFLNGNMDELIEALIAADRADRLKEGNI